MGLSSSSKACLRPTRCESWPEDRNSVYWPAEVVRGSVLVGCRHQSSCPTGVAPRRPVLERYSHIRILAKQTALEEIDRRRAAQDATRTKPNVPEAQTQRHAATAANVA
jgi:hypothetical protein